MFARAVEAPPSQRAEPAAVRTVETRPAWRDERIPLLSSLPNFMPGTHPVEDEDDIVAVVDQAMEEHIKTPVELREWLNRQQMMMVRSGMLGRDFSSPTAVERPIKTLAKYLAVRRSIIAQMGRTSSQE